MRALLTSDDGIESEGLKVLVRIAHKVAEEVWIVAPKDDVSGGARSISLLHPIRLTKYSDRTVAISGSTADSVIMALKTVLPEPPDLLLVGVNAGQNVCNNTFYSSTVGAAIEGALAGILSIALSQAIVRAELPKIYWETAETFAPDIITKLVNSNCTGRTFFNVNFPAISPLQVKGVNVTVLGQLDNSLGVESRTDGRGLPYYWLKFGQQRNLGVKHSDVSAIENGSISVTPLHLDINDHASHPIVQQAFS